jgi:hypothetical protein
MSNDFIPFAVGGSANVITQSAYAALTPITQNGFQSGIAQSNQLNKVWRQSSIMAAVLAQFIVDQSGQNAVDDGTTSTLEANLLSAIKNATKQTVILTDTGAANAYAAANTPALTVLPSTGYVQRVNIAHANTGASTYAPDGLTAKPIYGLGLQPLQGGELPVGVAVLMYLVQAGVNSGNGAWIIIESLGGASQIAPATQSQHALQLGQATGRLLRTTVYRNNAGTLQASIDGGAYANISSTLALQSLTTKARVHLIAGGGAGGGNPVTGGSAFAYASGGGEGGWAIGLYTAAQLNGQTVTVGLGGAGVAGNNGNAGGSSSVGAVISATGGPGGPVGVSNAVPTTGFAGGAVGGAGSGGQINGNGAYGAYGTYLGSTGISGKGGGAHFGDGGAPAGPGLSSGSAAVNPGSGGGGAASPSSSGIAASGGTGANGIIIIEEFA